MCQGRGEVVDKDLKKFDSLECQKGTAQDLPTYREIAHRIYDKST